MTVLFRLLLCTGLALLLVVLRLLVLMSRTPLFLRSDGDFSDGFVMEALLVTLFRWLLLLEVLAL